MALLVSDELKCRGTTGSTDFDFQTVKTLNDQDLDNRSGGLNVAVYTVQYKSVTI